MNTHRVAVYGTLREGEGNFRLLRDAVKDGTHRIGGFVMYSNGGFPYAVEGEGQITVETYSVDDRTLRNLDMLEGYPHHYDRREVDVNGKPAWIYFVREGHIRLDLLNAVPDGDWVAHRKSLYID